MRNRFERQLLELNNELIQMGSMIERAIEMGISALVRQDVEKAKKAIAYDEEIDGQEKTVESLCMKLLLQQQPVAKDLRLISAALKMITDMERIGDQAADIRLLLGVGPVGVEVILCRQLGKAFIAELLVQKLLHRQFGEAQLVRQVYGDLPCGAACHKRSSFSLSSVVQLKLMPPTWTFTAATLKPVIPSSAVCTFFWTFLATSLMAQP